MTCEQLSLSGYQSINHKAAGFYDAQVSTTVKETNTLINEDNIKTHRIPKTHPLTSASFEAQVLNQNTE